MVLVDVDVHFENSVMTSKCSDPGLIRSILELNNAHRDTHIAIPPMR